MKKKKTHYNFTRTSIRHYENNGIIFMKIISSNLLPLLWWYDVVSLVVAAFFVCVYFGILRFDPPLLRRSHEPCTSRHCFKRNNIFTVVFNSFSKWMTFFFFFFQRKENIFISRCMFLFAFVRTHSISTLGALIRVPHFGICQMCSFANCMIFCLFSIRSNFGRVDLRFWYIILLCIILHEKKKIIIIDFCDSFEIIFVCHVVECDKKKNTLDNDEMRLSMKTGDKWHSQWFPCIFNFQFVCLVTHLDDDKPSIW